MTWRWRRRDREAELDREIRDHLDLENEEHQRLGLSDADATREARRLFGNPVVAREDVREAWGWQWLERLRLDTRLAVRLWLRTPGFSAVAVATIGLGIGASTALVAQVKAVFWTPLPVSAPHELRTLAWTSPRHTFVNGPNVLPGQHINGVETFVTVSYPAFLAMRDQATAFSDIACWADLGEARPVILGDLGFGTVQFVSGNYFRALGVGAALGRTLEPQDESPAGWSPVAMVSHRFWVRTFGAAPDVTSRTLRLNGRVFAIVGVMPQGFFGLDPAVSPDIIAPSGAVEVAATVQNPLQNAGLWNSCRIVARVAPGHSDEEARTQLEHVLNAAIAAAPPAKPYDPPRIWLVPAGYGLSTLREGTVTPLVVLVVVVAGLLLAACANIAGLMLARSSARSREIATRLALGASRARVVRQLMTESLVLSLAGCIFGLVLAHWLTDAGSTLLSQFMPTLFGADRTLNLGSMMDAKLLVFATILAIVSGLLFGALPALRATRLDLVAVIKENAGSGLPRFGLSSGQAMVMAQTALAIFLLMGAGLFIRTLANLRSTDLGFQTEGLLYARIEPRSGGLGQAQRQQFFEDAVARLNALPGVRSAAASGVAPFGGDSTVGSNSFPVCRSAVRRAATAPEMVAFSSVTPGYFRTMGVPMIAGDDFGSSDSATSRGRRGGVGALVVNEAFAREYLGGQGAVGQSVMLGFDCSKPFDNPPVIGVVADSRMDLRTAATPMVYLPLGDFAGPLTLIVRAADDPSAMIPTIRRAMTGLNANTPTFSETSVAELIERRLRRERLLSSLLAVFAGMTMLICCLGIYGLLSYSVQRRRQEISVRIAIGAKTTDIVRMVLRESLVPVVAGIAIGSTMSILATRSLARVLYGVSSYDPLVLVGACGLFLLVALAAAAFPSRAAAKVSPVLALRQ